jgi:hypothetical protein
MENQAPAPKKSKNNSSSMQILAIMFLFAAAFWMVGLVTGMVHMPS